MIKIYGIKYPNTSIQKFMQATPHCNRNNEPDTGYSRSCVLNSSYPIYFGAVKFSKGKFNISPIKTEEEYFEVLNKVCNSKTTKGENFWTINDDLRMYKDIDSNYIGLLPYCGTNDVSYYINRYLRNCRNLSPSESHISYEPTIESISDIIRALDYSLARLDETYGKYKGITYRNGYFSPRDKQFYSSSISPRIAAGFTKLSADNLFSIIKTKNAHNIYQFQRDMKSIYAVKEKEILIPREASHRLIKPNEYDDEILKAKNDFARAIILEAKYSHYPKLAVDWSFDKAFDKIKVYEEI